MPGSFIDSNVLLDLASADTWKATRAEQVVAAGGTISVQVLNEVANVARRKMGMSWDELHEFLATLRALLQVVPVSLETHDTGLALAERYGFPLYDAMIVASAVLSGSAVLWSEDMQHGLAIEGGPRIANPFRSE